MDTKFTRVASVICIHNTNSIFVYKMQYNEHWHGSRFVEFCRAWVPNDLTHIRLWNWDSHLITLLPVKQSLTMMFKYRNRKITIQ